MGVTLHKMLIWRLRCEETQDGMLSASRQTVEALKHEPLTFLAIAPDKSYS
jgi:hypothetical protein